MFRTVYCFENKQAVKNVEFIRVIAEAFVVF